MSTDTAVRTFIAHEASAFVEDLKAWLRIPSVSGDPERIGDVRASAEWLAAALRAAGFPIVEVWETAGGAGLPAVFAEWPSGNPDAPTVAVYGHHDVQPVTPLELWHNGPF